MDLSSLPSPILLNILDFLTAKQISVVAQISSKLWGVTKDEDLWKRKCNRIKVVNVPGKTWRETFIAQFRVLYPFYSEIASGQISSPSLKTPSQGNPFDNATLIHQLYLFSNEHYLPNGRKIKEDIEEIRSNFAASLIPIFEDAYDTKNWQKLREYYGFLVALGEQKIVAQRFIAKHPLFLNLSLVQLLASGESKEIPKPPAFFEDIQKVATEQLPIIEEVFKEVAKPVQHLFMERLFGQSITEYADYVLEKAHHDGNSIFVKTLVSLFECCYKLIDALTPIIERQFLIELLIQTFSKYEAQYLTAELSYLGQIYEMKITSWSNNNGYVDIKSPLSKKKPPTGTSAEPAPLKIDKTKNFAILLSVELCLEIIYENKNAIKRATLVSFREDLKKNAEELFILMLKTIGAYHVDPVMKQVIASLVQINDHETSEQFSVSNQLFDLIHIADLIQQLIDKAFDENIEPLIPKETLRNKSLMQKKVFEKQLDENVATCLDLIIEYMIKRVEFLLRTYQKPDDFNRSLKGPLTPTHACVLAIECIDSHVKRLKGCTEKATLDALFSEIATRFFLSLWAHFKKFRINLEGGKQLVCDLEKYSEYISHLGLPKAKKQFQSLLEVGKLFTLSPNELQKRLEEEDRFEVEDLSMEELRSFLRSSRTDSKDPKVAKTIDGEACLIS